MVKITLLGVNIIFLCVKSIISGNVDNENFMEQKKIVEIESSEEKHGDTSIRCESFAKYREEEPNVDSGPLETKETYKYVENPSNELLQKFETQHLEIYHPIHYGKRECWLETDIDETEYCRELLKEKKDPNTGHKSLKGEFIPGRTRLEYHRNKGCLQTKIVLVLACRVRPNSFRVYSHYFTKARENSCVFEVRPRQGRGSSKLYHISNKICCFGYGILKKKKKENEHDSKNKKAKNIIQGSTSEIEKGNYNFVKEPSDELIRRFEIQHAEMHKRMGIDRFGIDTLEQTRLKGDSSCTM